MLAMTCRGHAQARWTRSSSDCFAHDSRKGLPAALPAGAELRCFRAEMEWPVIGEGAGNRLASGSQVDLRSSAGGEHAIPFGKWRSTLVKNVPKEYLQFLCLWDNYKTTQKTLLDSDARQWMWRSHPETVQAARTYVKTHNLCRECFRPLVPVGTARANGKAHADWANRQYHKQCWRHLERDSESDEDMED